MDELPFEKVKRKVYVKHEATTDDTYGVNPYKRDIKTLINYGVININKNQGPTSHQVTDYVKKILNLDKSGHSGTLDPNVVGCLPVALGKATRIVQTLLPAGKEYTCLMHLHDDVEKTRLKNKIKEFIGRIEQLPPVRSAVKRQKRFRNIYYLKILEIDGRDVLFRVGCEAGTYIRKLVHDFGNSLGTGANMAQLVRTKAGPFSYKKMFSLIELKDAYEFYKSGNEEELRKIIQPIEDAVAHLSKIWVLDSAVDTICHGADLSIPGINKFNEFEEGETVAIMTLKNELVALGQALVSFKNVIENDKGKVIKTKKVFMERGTYLKYIKNGKLQSL